MHLLYCNRQLTIASCITRGHTGQVRIRKSSGQGHMNKNHEMNENPYSHNV